MAKPISEQIQDATRSDTLIGKTHAQLKNDIIVGHLRPGEKLRVEHLKQDYNVSGGTLREALTMLIADRLVVAEGQRGFRVKPVSASDLIDLHRMRILLEKNAIRESIANGDAEWEGKVVSSFHLLKRAEKALTENVSDPALFDEWEHRHREFHTSLFAAAPSEWTRYFLEVTYQQCERYRHMFHALTQDMAHEIERAAIKERDLNKEHTEIFNAVLERDADAAAALLAAHLLRTLDEWTAFFQKTGTLDPAQAASGEETGGNELRVRFRA